MKLLITGATGFIGRSLCRTLTDAGHTVVALSRNPASAQRRAPSIHRLFPWAPLVSPPPSEAFEGVDAVVNLAGETIAGLWTAAKKRAIRDSRVVGARNLVLAMEQLQTRPRVLISASAVGYYGDGGDEPITEEGLPGAGFLPDLCRGWEEEALRAQELGVRVVCLRNGLVVGPSGGALAPLLPLFKLGLGGPLGSGRQWWPWVHLDDVVGVMLYAVGKELRGVYNLTAPNPVRQRELARTLGRVLRRPAILPVPAFALKLVLRGFASELLDSRRVVPHRLTEAGYTFRFTELEPALRRILAGSDKP